MKLSKTFKKILFFWIIFHSIAYFCYLAEIHPHSNYDKTSKFDIFSSTTQYTNYYLIPETSDQEEREKFYPFHDFIEESWGGGYTYSKFVGIFGYYGTYEYLLYVILPLFVIGMIWIYRTFIDPIPHNTTVVNKTTGISSKEEEERSFYVPKEDYKNSEKKKEITYMLLFIIFLIMLTWGILRS